MEQKEILIVDDHQLISAGLRLLLNNLDSPVQISECNSGREALRILEDGQRFDLIIIDINMPSFSGVDLLGAIKARKLNTAAAMISASVDIPEIQNCLDAGARGFIPKSSPPTLILEGIKQLLDGRYFIPPHIEEHVYVNKSGRGKGRGSVDTPLQEPASQNQDSISLKHREVEILNLLKAGKSNKDIAAVLNISTSTVKFHIAKLFRKFNARSRTECVSLAVQNNLLEI